MSLIYSLYIINKSGGLIYSRVSRGVSVLRLRPVRRPRVRRPCDTVVRPPSLKESPPTNHAPPKNTKDFEGSTARMDLNDSLRLASIW